MSSKLTLTKLEQQQIGASARQLAKDNHYAPDRRDFPNTYYAFIRGLAFDNLRGLLRLGLQYRDNRLVFTSPWDSRKKLIFQSLTSSLPNTDP